MIYMLDIKKIQSDPVGMAKKMAAKGVTIDFAELIEKYERRKSINAENDALRNRRKTISKKIGIAMKNGSPDGEALAQEVKEVNEKIKANEALIAEIDQYVNKLMLELPNPPADGVAPGGKENNEVVKIHGVKPEFNFIPKNHVDLAESLDLIDYKRGVKLSGSGYWVYTRVGAMLEWALLNYFVENHLADGYEMLLLPHILNQDCGLVAGQFPKFYDEVYYLDNTREKFILPTAETALVNLHRDEILNEDELPKRYFAFTPCYRKEAGSSRADERGMIRGHQFNKVELVQYAHPDHSMDSLKEMLAKAEKLVAGLGLHYRVSKLAAEDCSWAMATTFDVEVWIPSMGIYKEVSSVSNAFDYQARRGNVRFRDVETGKTRFVHTLNASGLATSRIFPAILEQFQQEDGSVKVPDVLKKWLPFDYIK
jgi:seryl-tRNA synthetase